jgi:hypothetical protein
MRTSGSLGKELNYMANKQIKGRTALLTGIVGPPLRWAAPRRANRLDSQQSRCGQMALCDRKGL